MPPLRKAAGTLVASVERCDAKLKKLTPTTSKTCEAVRTGRITKIEVAPDTKKGLKNEEDSFLFKRIYLLYSLTSECTAND
jgi:hypothetical protein